MDTIAGRKRKMTNDDDDRNEGEPQAKRRKLTVFDGRFVRRVTRRRVCDCYDAQPKSKPSHPPPRGTGPSCEDGTAALTMSANVADDRMTLTWDVNPGQTGRTTMYELFACNPTVGDRQPIDSTWKLVIGNVEPFKPPVRYRLNPVERGFKYRFAVRAVDGYGRRTALATVCATIPSPNAVRQ